MLIGANAGDWLDSGHLLETILPCEEAFGGELDPDVDLRAGALRSVGTLFELIHSKRAG